MTTSEILEAVKRLAAIANTGLLYCSNEFDIERYKEVREISLSLLSKVTDHKIEELKIAFPLSEDYPTAKVDVRGLVLSGDHKILLAKESIDGRWSLPGGWADIGYTPKETAIKELKEEAGLDVKVERLLAVFDKRLHPHPPQPHYVYKMIFYCTALSSAMQSGFDMLDVDYFSINDLPPLSEDRIIKAQIELVYKKAIEGDMETYFE